MKKSDIFWQLYLSLEKELIEVSKFIYIADVVNAHEGGKEVMKPCDAQLMTKGSGDRYLNHLYSM